MKRTIAFYTLGCKVNQYETQALRENFQSRGFQTVGDESPADVYVINTCTVTNLADRKSRQYIRKMKRLNPESIIAVTGCYAEVSPDEVSKIEGVDLIVGNKEKYTLPDRIDDLLRKSAGELAPDINKNRSAEEMAHEFTGCGPVTAMDSKTRAYIKIQDGCNQFCSYCIIPYARGPIKSRDFEDIVEEAKVLLAKGFKELVLTGINTALYGKEKEFKIERENANISEEVNGIEIIVKLLNDLPGEFRIRLGSLEPNVIDALLAKRLLKYDKLCHHMHLSLQSGSDRILNSMNRHYNRHEFLEIVKVLRDADEHYGLTTDVIVGFPGETQEDYENSKELVSQVGFLKTHVFPYSERKGTKAADMADMVDPKTKKERAADLIAASDEAASVFLEKAIGSTGKILFEEYDRDDGLVIGYSDNYIKVYCGVSDHKEGEMLVNTLQDVEFAGIYKDGMKGRMKGNCFGL